MKNSKMLLQKGEKFYAIGKILCIVLLGAIALLILTLMVASLLEGPGAIVDCLTFTVHKSYAFVNTLIGLAYLGCLVGAAGPVLYFNGLHLIGLGQIAENTNKE